MAKERLLPVNFMMNQISIGRRSEQMNTTWMIRNDGKAFPCGQHIHTSFKNVEEALFAAEWLYANTLHEESRQLVLETVAAWVTSVSVDGDVISNAFNSILQKPECPLSQEFVKAHVEEIKALSTEKLDLATLYGEVAAELNQEFLRASYGGMYHTDASSKKMFFCISSIGFGWYKIMHNFVASADFPIECMIIVWNNESAGAGNKLSLRLPTKTFLSERPIQLVPLRKLKGGVMAREIFAHLSYGSSLRHISWDLEIGANELANTLAVISDWENQSVIESN